ncbi:hypothetical protein [Xanthocytophaga agilis]|uniref:Uncharacterized protein n=1 Tax=Xanthocytophaga agilis TaxID=3048010 RepID=A0AAE3RDC0_9BACT|nr:hypothetical protein [Xanthocytophaga agilis]MDJ1506299.1 hypothetical protein [Xanthocytophaga agilis]
MFRSDNKGGYYVPDDTTILLFNSKGTLLNKIHWKSLDKDITGVYDMVSDENGLMCISYGKIFHVDLLGNSTLISTANFNGHIRITANHLLITDYFTRDTSTTENNTYNGLAITDTSGNMVSYPIQYDYENTNFEIAEDKILLYGIDNYFYQLPLDTLQPIKRNKLELSEYDRAWFLGKIDDQFIFKTHNYITKIDHIFFFSADLKLIREAIVDLPTYGINRVFFYIFENGFDFPSGIIYSYEPRQNAIFLLRNTYRGAVVYNLMDVIK